MHTERKSCGCVVEMKRGVGKVAWCKGCHEASERDLRRQLAQRDERIKWLEAAYGSSPSEVCRTHHVQNCHYCDDLGCGDNTSEAARRIAALEARIKELESGLAALAPVVRAAARVVGAYGRGPLAGRLGLDLHHDTNGLIGAFCALPADLLERMGVNHAA